MPCSMGLTKDAAKVMIELLDAFGVQPECLALPKQPGRPSSKLCSKDSLVALTEVLLDYSRGNLTDQLKKEYGQVKRSSTSHAASIEFSLWQQYMQCMRPD